MSQNIKRLCLFAGYDSKGVILKYVIHYVKAMSELADVYYMADCEMAEDELSKLTPYTKEHYALRHKKYDFGSWQELINKIGWDKVAEYDELILCNDSCFGPLNNSLPYIFEKASNDDECDFWGASAPLDNQYLQSYFLVFKKNVFMSPTFKGFIDNIKSFDNKINILEEYEVGLYKKLIDAHFQPKQIIDILGDVYNNWNILIKKGFPFLKLRSFYFGLLPHQYSKKLSIKNIKYLTKGKMFSAKNIDKFLAKYIIYNLDNIYDYLDHINIDKKELSKTSINYKIAQIKIISRQFRRSIYFSSFKHKDRHLISIFGIPIYNKGAMKPLLTYKELKELSRK